MKYMHRWYSYGNRIKYVYHGKEVYICLDGRLHSWGYTTGDCWYLQILPDPAKIGSSSLKMGLPSERVYCDYLATWFCEIII